LGQRFYRKNHSWDYFVGDCLSLRHVACHHMDCVPNSLFDFFLVLDNLLDKETRVESLLLSINQVYAWVCVVIVQSHIGGEHVVGLLLKLKEMSGRVKSTFSFWEVLVAPWRSVRIAIAVVLMLQVDFPATLISLNILNKPKP
jgi:hypothetical protein